MEDWTLIFKIGPRWLPDKSGAIELAVWVQFFVGAPFLYGGVWLSGSLVRKAEGLLDWTMTLGRWGGVLRRSVSVVLCLVMFVTVVVAYVAVLKVLENAVGGVRGMPERSG